MYINLSFPFILLIIVAITIATIVVTVIIGNSGSNRAFPRKFKFGVATASYQVEGGWNADGKGENIWDHICHTNPSFVYNEDNGDVACDSYNLYERDVEMLNELGVDFYRFSLSWTRILPTGYPTQINQAGVDYYRNLISLLIANRIVPFVIIYHWDLPQPFQEIGGWPNPQLEALYVDYARVVFEQFGDLVKNWITFNEPMQICSQGYGNGTLAPGIARSGLEDYACVHTIIKAHARAWHLYDTEFRPFQKGRISITIDTSWFQPVDPNDPDDAAAAERAQQFSFGWFGNPIFNRNYPQVMIDAIAERSSQEGFLTSRLPTFTEEELDYISGTHDFLGLNFYTSFLTTPMPEQPIGNASYWADRGVISYQNDSWIPSASFWLKMTPWGIRDVVNWLRAAYNDPEIIITENGFSDEGLLDDQKRIEFLRTYLTSLLQAILDDGVRVTHYTAWSLMDNFEWTAGYSQKFGLYNVNFSDPQRTRTPKSSVSFYSKVIRTRRVDNH